QKQLFHCCMAIIVAPLQDWTPRQMIDAEGFPRLTVTIPIAYIADLEEQWMLAALQNNQCPNC
ncbi:hypothetical protein BS47DRAFT_1269999, partial [Hydnum rufescens UP504]